MSDQGSILVLSSSNLEDVKLGDYFPTANVSTVMGPNNTVVPNPFPQIPSVLPPTSYFTRLTKRDLTVNEKAQTVRDFFELEGPPPTELTVQVDTKFLNLHVRSFNNQVKVYLTKYLLDCVWRDAETPTGPNGNLTANAGTSTSQRVRVYLFAGNPSSRESVRLLNIPMFRDGDNDPDFIIHRNQACVYEKSHNPYHPNLNLSSDLYFENQYTQQTETFQDPGFYLGTIHPQAIQALQRMREITIRWETDRAPEFPSPFWDAKFLRGSSVWNPTTSEFEVQEPAYRYNVYFQRANTLSLAVVSGNTVTGGPYFPLTLYTLEDPINLGVAPFINNPNSTLLNVKDPKEGELCPLNHEGVTLRVGQMAIGNTTALGQVKTLNLRKMAPSDKDAFQVPIFDATLGNTGLLTVYDRSSATIPPRYAVSTTPAGNASLHFPNGEWRGQPMSSGNTSVVDWKSPFPWEQSLTSNQLSVLNEKSAYETSANVQILNAHKYLFMDPGTAWNEHGGNVTIGERSLQFDFGTDRDFMINKFQLIFPKSQEDHQPYRLEASMQKAFKDTADQVRQDVQSTFWMGGVQFSKLTGSWDSPEEYRYLNTHSQTNAGLDGSYTQLWDVRSRQVGSSFTAPSSSSGETVQFATTDDDTRGRSNVVLPSTGNTWYSDDPNEINPALDFQRQEFGPFTRGCTMAELKDTDKCKAWTGNAMGSVAMTSPVTTGNVFFFDLLNYMSSSAGIQALGYSVYVRASVDVSAPTLSSSDWRSVTTSSTGDRFAAVERGNVHTYVDGTWTLRPAFASSLTYTSISSSGSGNVLMASVGGGSIYLSRDQGNARIELNATNGASQAESLLWQDVTLSVDGLTGLAVANANFVYKYSAGGGILNPTPTLNVAFSIYSSTFIDIAASQTGSTMAAITEDRLYVSVNSGATWTDRTPLFSISEVDVFNAWKSVAVSADGTRIAAVPTTGRVIQATGSNFTSTSWVKVTGMPGSARKQWYTIVYAGNYQLKGVVGAGILTYSGTSWSPVVENALNDLDMAWGVNMASSADGSKLIAAVSYGRVWMWENNGLGWIEQTVDLPEEYWTSVSISANGTHAAAVVEDGYVYLFPYGGDRTWRRVDSVGLRTWYGVDMSQDGQYMYASVYDGYIYGSTDYGITWTRDVSPVSYAAWIGLVVRASGGVAITEDGLMFALNVGSTSTIGSSLVSKTSIPLAWRSVDSSNDGEIAVAVVYNGNVFTSQDSGETWKSQPGPGVRPWIAATVSADGKRRVALSADGFVATSFTTNAYFPGGSLGSWAVHTTAPAANHVWSSLDCSDDFSILLATQTSTNGTSGTGRVYVTDGNVTTFNLDARISTTARWNTVSITRDGKRAIVGAMTGPLEILDSGDLWYRLTNSDINRRTLATNVGRKARTKTAASLPPSILLNAEFEGVYAGMFGETFDVPVYDYAFDNYKMYLVDCTREATSTIAAQMLLEETDGQLVFYDNETAASTVSATLAAQYPNRLYRVQGTLAPALDYIVKESYYFAPKYDQYDTLASTTFGGSVNVFAPRSSTRAQKVVNPTLGVGRYFGVAFGSFLYDGVTNNQVYTRGPGNAMKLFSFRPLTQLFSFKSNCGVLQDRTGKATTLATFQNTITKGMLQNVELVTSGKKYVDKDLTPYIHPTLDETEEGMYYDAKTGTFADTPIFLLTGTTGEIVRTASNATVVRPRHAQVTYTMVDDTTIPEVLDFYKASDKNALRRSAEFHLRVLSSTKVTTNVLV